MTEELVRYELPPPAVLITLNRPDKRNALSRALIQSLKDAFLRARDDSAARCVILTGAGPAFCAGMDLSELAETLHQPAESAVWEDARRLAGLYDLIYTFPKPTIAAVNGAAVAGGGRPGDRFGLSMGGFSALFRVTGRRLAVGAAIVIAHLLPPTCARHAR